MAYGLPILQHLASDPKSPQGTSALILAPTRELAIQVMDHLKATSKFLPQIKLAAIVGGMSIQKQKRLLSKTPDILVATPGRLFELFEDEPQIFDQLQNRLKFVVIDEADRMLESGHFKELDAILQKVSIKALKNEQKRQTFLFSATLLQDKTLNAPLHKKGKKSSQGKTTHDMIKRIEFSDPNPVYVNVAREGVLAESVVERRVDCLVTEKDSILYYVLLRYPGRTIVFVNSIDAIRRLVPILSLLQVQAYPLHAEMQQRQRLKNLDRFKSNSKAALIATDVAARGLDIPNIEHVVHYQLPRSTDLYVHRSGRTARANKEGISVMLCSPDQMSIYKKICFTLNKPRGIPTFPIDRSLMTSINQRLNLAKKIDEVQHKMKKEENEKSWFAKAAEEADIEIDEDEFLFKGGSGSKNKKEAMDKVQGLKKQLSALLSQKMIPKGISAKYLTSNAVPELVDILLESQKSDTQMPTKRKRSAIEDITGH
jgi:ATP-dependent RNA helicase DDX24/MAK5